MGMHSDCGEVVLGRKFCAKCGRWRYVMEFSRRSTETGKLRGACKTCERVRSRGNFSCRLDPEPMLAVLRDYRARHHGANVREGSWRTLSALSGVSERSINRWWTGQSKHVELLQADKVAVALGIPLGCIYPWDEQ